MADVRMATPTPQARAGAPSSRRPSPKSGSAEKADTCAIKAVLIKPNPSMFYVVAGVARTHVCLLPLGGWVCRWARRGALCRCERNGDEPWTVQPAQVFILAFAVCANPIVDIGFLLYACAKIMSSRRIFLQAARLGDTKVGGSDRHVLANGNSTNRASGRQTPKKMIPQKKATQKRVDVYSFFLFSFFFLKRNEVHTRDCSGSRDLW
ncbi:hypothetical protein TW95_gp0981 [Pandoravirus inopinatum]|uniref:Uncharacterized protein n=1 Tax=Pandoravirus inopinatum TaxID=1605721 RepID=A0A0B5J7A5_9VIRU|nr:hypothetical protein TW95_gp0981 [Pandoravirus inopinatum]AJF97715.1 hypothetical protein [Pandoravirus inopinatum]